tara:strand:- start:17327 stop:17740 length:414 start_codon:yes stop_codon:yes gene_type:complete
MSAASDYVENQILDFYLNQGTGAGGSISAPSNIYLGLFTSAPSDAGGGTEVSGNGYTRIEITDKFNNASGTGGSLASNADITGFTADGGAWGTVNSIGIFDHVSSGNLLFYATISDATVNDGDSFQISSGNLTVTVA